MSDEFQFDVFISYSSKDKAWVRGELLKRIEQAGLKAFIDFRDFTRGAPSINEMERGVVQCRKTLLILTPDYVASGWGELENIMVQTLDPANRDLRTIPLLKAECKKPLRIGALTHIDFTDDADLDLAWRQLLTALGAAPELPPPKEPEHATWYLAHPYPMPPNFTGRVSERGTLTRWLNEDAAHPLLVLRALGGFGKSALTWHWLTHDVDAKQWPHVVWWSFYEGDASFDHFVAEALVYLYGEQIKAQKLSARDALVALLNGLHQSGTLLVLDGFERVLCAFGGLEAAYQGDEAKPTDHDHDCVSPLAENFLYNLATLPQLRSKVLLTTRLRPRVVEAKGGGLLEGGREITLQQMQPEDAVAFFHAQGIRGTHTEIELACEPYGYHPLSLRLLAGLIIGDFQQPGDIAAAKRLDVSGDLVQRQHHVLEQAYESLTPARRKLLGAIACFRWAVSYDTLQAATESTESTDTLDRDLRDLISRGLLHHEVQELRFDLHPIVRHYAYDRLAAPERAAAHTRLRDYFAAVPEVEKVTRLEDLAPVIELYHHTVRAGQFDEARTLFHNRLATPLYYQLGAYSLRIDLLRALFPDGEDRPPHLEDENDQAWTLNALAISYSLSGQPRRGVPLYEQHNAIYEKQGETGKRNLAIGLGNLAAQQLAIGALRAADANLRRSIALCREIKDEFWKAVGHAELGRLLASRGEYAYSETELTTAAKMFEEQNVVQYHGVTRAYRAQCELLRLRSVQDSARRTPNSALAAARRALELTDETARTSHPYERDYVRAHWLLGAAHRVAGQRDEAEGHLHEALERCRRNNTVEAEADILIDLARLRAATGAPDEALRLAEEARVIAERSGFVMQGADAHLELARLALARGYQPLTREHAQQAKALATCDGPPDYTYKAAYDEATALLQQLA
ncbi:MAG TPA: toll/interleukin-1 receptor domain-containing protein [Pyrinomonadaceae bacterium]|nr:toll/interleukin-1 receptor domain-containing protein [Pyrinomonadaceae bacterium]